MKGGSIIPILQHDDCMALLACIENPIKLEIYQNENGYAEGTLYLDDGFSLNYLRDENSSTIIKFVYEDNILTSDFLKGN